jgi:hypothetical protein
VTLRKTLFAAACMAGLAGSHALAAEHESANLNTALSDADCGKLACRPAGPFAVTGGDPLPLPPTPYVTADGWIVIFPGETLVVEFPDAGETPGLPRYVADPSDKQKNTLKLTFESRGTGSMLFLESALPNMLKMDATMSIPARGGLFARYTSTCPVFPKGVGSESWQPGLGPLVLRNFHFLPAGGTTISCE